VLRDARLRLADTSGPVTELASRPAEGDIGGVLLGELDKGVSRAGTIVVREARGDHHAHGREEDAQEGIADFRTEVAHIDGAARRSGVCDGGYTTTAANAAETTNTAVRLCQRGQGRIVGHQGGERGQGRRNSNGRCCGRRGSEGTTGHGWRDKVVWQQ
jgi:hypothetical protein